MGVILTLFAWSTGRADSVIMKNGLVFPSQGSPDKDNSLVYIWDGLKRVIVRDSKIEKMVADNSFRTGERFSLVQPMVVHAGSMPKEVLRVQAEPWDDRGRRQFRYLGTKSGRPVSMEQAIIEIGPHMIKYRGVDGFWLGVEETNQVPRPVVMSLLGRVDPKNAGERERVVRFLMDAGWYPEAKEELDRLSKDFPQSDLSERASAPGDSSSRRRRIIAGPRSTCAASRSSTGRFPACSRRSLTRRSAPRSRSRSARSSAMRPSYRPRTRCWRPNCDSSPADSRMTRGHPGRSG